MCTLPANFFEKPFSEDVGNILFEHPSSGEEISLMSPENISDGWLKKKWAIIDGKCCLLKGGGATQQEPYNEVLASRLMEQLQISHLLRGGWSCTSLGLYLSYLGNITSVRY